MVKSLSLCIVLAFSFLNAADIDKKLSHRFDVSGETTLVLQSGDGDVLIEKWDEAAVEVNVVYNLEHKYATKSSIVDFDVEFARRGNELFVTGKEYREKSWVFNSPRYRDYIYNIKVPQKINIEIIGDDGNIEISDVEGYVDCRNDDGRITVMNILGDVKIQSEDGDIILEAVKGDVRAKTDDGDMRLVDIEAEEIELSGNDGRIKGRSVSGDIYIQNDDGDILLSDVSGPRLYARSNDGDVEIECRENIDNISISSEDGRITLVVGSAVDAEYTLSSDDGYINLDAAGHKPIEDRKNYRRGVLGNGNGVIKLQSRDGAIRLSVN